MFGGGMIGEPLALLGGGIPDRGLQAGRDNLDDLIVDLPPDICLPKPAPRFNPSVFPRLGIDHPESIDQAQLSEYRVQPSAERCVLGLHSPQPNDGCRHR
jgi:hypothetical protein